jgi:hypothetical protein
MLNDEGCEVNAHNDPNDLNVQNEQNDPNAQNHPNEPNDSTSFLCALRDLCGE